MTNEFPLTLAITSLCAVFGASFFFTETHQYKHTHTVQSQSSQQQADIQNGQNGSLPIETNIFHTHTNQENASASTLSEEKKNLILSEVSKQKDFQQTYYPTIQDIQIGQSLYQIGLTELESLPYFPVLLSILKELSKYKTFLSQSKKQATSSQEQRLNHLFVELVNACETMCLITQESIPQTYLKEMTEVNEIVKNYRLVQWFANELVKEWYQFEKSEQEKHQKRINFLKKRQELEERKSSLLVFDDEEDSLTEENRALELTEEEKNIHEEEEAAERFRRDMEQIESEKLSGKSNQLVFLYNPLFELKRFNVKGSHLEPQEKRILIKRLFDQKMTYEILELYFEVLFLKLQECCFEPVFSRFGIPNLSEIEHYIEEHYQVQISSFTFSLTESLSSTSDSMTSSTSSLMSFLEGSTKAKGSV